MNVDDFANLSFEELAQRKRALDSAYAEKFGLAQAAFLKEMQDKAQALGFDIGMVSANSNAKKGKLKPKAPIMYQHPENPELTWSGRGKPKKWLQDLIAAGEDKEKYRI